MNRLERQAIIFFLVLSVAALSQGAEGKVTGVVLKIKGTASFMRDGRMGSLSPQTQIRGGDIIRTGANSEVSLKLASGHVVNIRPNSQFQVDEPGVEKNNLTSTMLYAGTVYIRRRPGGGKKKAPAFQLQTPSAVAGVRGTDFGASVAPDGSSMFGVEDGEIEVDAGEGRTVTLGLREGVEVGLEGKGPLKSMEYLPERDNLDNWLKRRKRAILRNPLPAAARLTRNLTAMVTRAEKLADVLSRGTEILITDAEVAEKNRVRGRQDVYLQRRYRVEQRLPGLIVRLRTLVRLDNFIQSRGRLLEWLVREATAPGAPTPRRAVIVLKRHKAQFDDLKERAAKIHAQRVRLLRERVPVLKPLIKYYTYK